MIQAIVFLPLLGFILAAAISLVGARARFPGAEPSDDDHHAPAHGQSVHAQGSHDDHHAPAEPAAAGSRAVEISVFVVHAFVQLREFLCQAQAAAPLPHRYLHRRRSGPERGEPTRVALMSRTLHGTSKQPRIFTIGYEGASADRFIETLKSAGVTRRSLMMVGC